MADVAMFGPGKASWGKEVENWNRESQNQQLTHCNFVKILKKVTERMTPEKIQDGFKKTGIWPLDATALQLDRCIGLSQQPSKL